MTDSETFYCKTLELDGAPISFARGSVRAAKRDLMKSWEGSLQDCDVVHHDLIGGSYAMRGETFDGRVIEGQVVIDHRSPTSRGVDLRLQGTEALTVDGQEW